MDTKKNEDWLKNYLNVYKNTIFNKKAITYLSEVKSIFINASKNGKKIIFAGNGGSAAIASHCSVDLTKNAGIRSINFNEADLITCFANDFGYENWVSKSIEYYADNGDVIVLISSSGNSMNMVQASIVAKKMKMKTITFTGFDKDNKLKKQGDINFWVDSRSYNIIEMTHHIWLLALVDLIIGKAEYSA